MKNNGDYLSYKLLTKKKCSNHSSKQTVNFLKEAYYNDPNNLHIKFKYTKALLKSKKTFDEGKQLLEEIANHPKKIVNKSKDHDLEYKLNAIYILGQIEKEALNIKKAQYLFTLLLKTDKKAQALFALGEIEKSAGNIEEARKKFEKIINLINEELKKEHKKKTQINTKYKYSAMFELGKIAKDNNNLDEARKIFWYLYNYHNIHSALKQLLFVEIKDENYFEAYQLLEKIIKQQPLNLELKNIIFFLKYKIGLLTDNDIKNNTNYFCRQLINYDVNQAIGHISLHLDEQCNNTHTLYNSNVDIESLFKYAQDNIASIPSTSSNICDKYVIECPSNISTISQIPTNLILVVTFLNSKNIIAMYPIPQITNKYNVTQKQFIL